MNTIIKGFAIASTLLVLVSCDKDDAEQQNACDLHDHTGSWSFIVNGDPSTEYVGQIDKYNDVTLNITYQPSTEWGYFFQTEVNCEDGLIFKQTPAGNHGTRTEEGCITATEFIYKDSTYINYTGTPQITVKTIVGTKL
jgi:hypothetical protein